MDLIFIGYAVAKHRGRPVCDIWRQYVIPLVAERLDAYQMQSKHAKAHKQLQRLVFTCAVSKVCQKVMQESFAARARG